MKRKRTNKQIAKKIKSHKTIRDSFPFSYDYDKALFFIKDTSEYIKMIQLSAVNIFGLSKDDQYDYISAFQHIFTARCGQIFSYEIGADIDGYLDDIDDLQSMIDYTDEQEIMRYEVLEHDKQQLANTAREMSLIDRAFILILKDTDIDRLDNKISEVIRSISNLLPCKLLSILDQTKIIYNYYNPYTSSFDGAFFDVLGNDIIDYICPTVMEKANDGLKKTICIDGIYTKELFVYSYTATPIFAYLSYLTMMPDVDFSLHFEQTEGDQLSKQLNKTHKTLTRSYNKESDTTAKASIQKQLLDIEKIISKMTGSDYRPLSFFVSLRIKNTDLDDLKRQISDIKNYARDINITLREGIQEQTKLLHTTAPICNNLLNEYNKMTTQDTLAWGFPLVFESLYDKGLAVFLGYTDWSNGVVFYNNCTRQNDRSNSNEFLAGNSGMGKTTLLMLLILTRFARNYKQYIIDVEGKELPKLARYLKGAVIDCANGNKGIINPLHIRFDLPDDDSDLDHKVALKDIFPLSRHIHFLRTFFRLYIQDTIGILHFSEIERALEEIYENCGITYNTSAEEIIKNFKNEDFPVMSDLHNHLIAKEDIYIQKYGKESKKVERINEVIALIRPLAVGADSAIFNHHTNIDLNNRLLCFVISGLQNGDERILRTQYYNIISYVWTDILSSDDNVWKQLYEDEFHVILDPDMPETGKFQKNIVKRIRKYKGGLSCATQQISDVLNDSVKEYGESIIENSTYAFYFGLGHAGVSYLTSTKLVPKSELDFVAKAKIGQCYMRIGTNASCRLNVALDSATKELFDAMKKN